MYPNLQENCYVCIRDYDGLFNSPWLLRIYQLSSTCTECTIYSVGGASSGLALSAPGVLRYLYVLYLVFCHKSVRFYFLLLYLIDFVVKLLHVYLFYSSIYIQF